MPPPRQRPAARTRSIPLILVAASLSGAAALGCSGSVTNAEEASQLSGPTQPAAALLSCAKGSFAQFTAVHECGAEITVKNGTGSPSVDAPLQTAVGRWSTKLNASQISGLPYLSIVPSNSSATVTVVGSTSGSIFCGQADVAGNGTTTITLSSGSACNGNKGTLADVLTHELGHAYGWKSGADKKGESGASDHCAMHLHDDFTVNSQVCSHDVEGAAAGYGLRTHDPDAFWTKAFAVSASALTPVTLVQGATHQYTPQWQIDGGGGVSGSFTWISTNTAVATANNGLITAIASGTTAVYLQGGTSSIYLRTYQFENRAGEVTITVTAPPLSALYVDDIVMNGLIPITAADSFTWTAIPAPGNSTGITYRWIIEFSGNTPPDSIFYPERISSDTAPVWAEASAFAGSTWRGYAHPGSYNIRIKVWPARNDSIGSPAIRDFPVCVDPTQYLRAPSDGDTDAVGGC